ncbi:MAG: choice-of-anchor C family protein [Gallionellaceae bacterium]|nr:choice-of-anchor C family protein [Gallionellaceae bacterium]
MNKIILLAALAFNLSTSAYAASNLISNGGFESYSTSGLVGGHNFYTADAGSNAIDGWTIGGTSVDLIFGGSYGAVTGTSIDMLGSPGPGSLSQIFDTIAGQTYILTFDLSANTGSDNTPAAKALYVSLNDAQVAAYTGTSTITSESLSFTATSEHTTLSFASGPTGGSGAVLDNVAVAAVPEPETYAMLMAGIGLLGFMGRGKKRSA